MKDISALHHREFDNHTMSKDELVNLFQRVPQIGVFMTNLGYATFFEIMTVMLLVKLYCFYEE